MEDNIWVDCITIKNINNTLS